MTPVKPFLYYTIVGLQQKIEEALHIERPQLNTVSDISNLVRSPEAKNLKYPISFFRITSMEISEEFNSNSLARRGARFDTKTDNRLDKGIRKRVFDANGTEHQSGVVSKSNANVADEDAEYSTIEIIMLPVKLSFELIFISNAYEHLLDFSTRWMFACLKARFNFIISYYGKDINVSSSLEPTLSIPTKDSVFSDLPDYYLYQANFTTTTYLTNNDDRDQREVPLIKMVKYNVQAN